jgi:hypothetical protein
LVGETVGVDHVIEFEFLRLGGVLAAWNDHDVGSRPSLGLRVSVFLRLGIELIKAWKNSKDESYLVVGDVVNGGLAFGALASCTFTLFLGGRLEKGWVRSVNESEGKIYDGERRVCAGNRLVRSLALGRAARVPD